MSPTSVTITAVEDVGADTVTIELESPDGFDAKPGQFVLVRATPADEAIARHYTLSSPTVSDTFEITVGVDPDGDLAPWLAERDPGEEITIDGPFGTIAYEGDEDVVAIAGGPGIGPAVAIAEAAIDADHRAEVIYRSDDPAHRDRLSDLREAGVPITIVDVGDDYGFQSAIEEAVDRGTIYAFGFDDFVGSVERAIDAAGGDPADARIENFG